MIEKKKKICKIGTGKASGFKGCGKEVYYFKYHLCKNCFLKWLHNTEAGLEYIKHNLIPTSKKVVKKASKQAKKELKIKSTNWKNELQKEINKIVRLIDKDQLCLARQIPCKQTHAGHISSRGAYSNIRFHLDNIHRQSAYSNTYCNDDDLMKEGLIREYGQEYHDYVKELCKLPIVKYTNEEYHQFIIKAKKIVRELQAKNKVYSKKERLLLRKKYNIELGIYESKYCENETK